jgi:hypothetical protein
VQLLIDQLNGLLYIQDSTKSKADKKAFPRSLDQALLEIDRTVEKHHKNLTKKFSGYIETLCEIVCPEITVGVMRRAITRVNVMSLCSQAKEKYTISLVTLEAMIRESICDAPSEEEQIRTFVLQKVDIMLMLPFVGLDLYIENYCLGKRKFEKGSRGIHKFKF